MSQSMKCAEKSYFSCNYMEPGLYSDNAILSRIRNDSSQAWDTYCKHRMNSTPEIVFALIRPQMNSKYSIPKSFGKWVDFSVGASPTPPFTTHLGTLYLSCKSGWAFLWGLPPHPLL